MFLVFCETLFMNATFLREQSPGTSTFDKSFIQFLVKDFPGWLQYTEQFLKTSYEGKEDKDIKWMFGEE